MPSIATVATGSLHASRADSFSAWEEGGEAEQDDPTARLEWQRKAWGVVSPEFRQSAIKEGRKHGSKKNAKGPKWVSIGPAGADYEQNGSFTGHVRDSGRARTVLPHPTNPDIVLPADVRRRAVADQQLAVEPDHVAGADRRPADDGRRLDGEVEERRRQLGLDDRARHRGLGARREGRTSTNRDIVLVATDSGLYRSAAS
jgi:hypothetical protein